MVHSVSRWTRGVQVKLWDPLRTCAIPERLRGVITTRRYTNPRLPLPLTEHNTAWMFACLSSRNTLPSLLTYLWQERYRVKTESVMCVCWNLQSNFLHSFSALSPHKSKKSKVSSSQLDSLWLALFVNLSFSTDGQTMILKIDGNCLSVCLSVFVCLSLSVCPSVCLSVCHSPQTSGMLMLATRLVYVHSWSMLHS